MSGCCCNSVDSYPLCIAVCIEVNVSFVVEVLQLPAACSFIACRLLSSISLGINLHRDNTRRCRKVTNLFFYFNQRNQISLLWLNASITLLVFIIAILSFRLYSPPLSIITVLQDHHQYPVITRSSCRTYCGHVSASRSRIPRQSSCVCTRN